MNVAATHLSSFGGLNSRRQERRINISHRSSKSRPRLSCTDLLHAADGNAKMAEFIESQYNIVNDVVAFFGKHEIVSFLYLYDAPQISQIQVWVLLKCVKVILLGSIDATSLCYSSTLFLEKFSSPYVKWLRLW